MRLHLDDRLLHGRILQGWGPRLGTRRYVLVSQRLPADELEARYGASAAQAGCEIRCCDPEAAAALGPPGEGEFWLTDNPVSAWALWQAGARIETLVLVGLRDAGGKRFAEDVVAGERSRGALATLADLGVVLQIQRFPDARIGRLFADELRAS